MDGKPNPGFGFLRAFCRAFDYVFDWVWGHSGGDGRCDCGRDVTGARGVRKRDRGCGDAQGEGTGWATSG